VVGIIGKICFFLEYRIIDKADGSTIDCDHDIKHLPRTRLIIINNSIYNIAGGTLTAVVNFLSHNLIPNQ